MFQGDSSSESHGRSNRSPQSYNSTMYINNGEYASLENPSLRHPEENPTDKAYAWKQSRQPAISSGFFESSADDRNHIKTPVQPSPEPPGQDEEPYSPAPNATWGDLFGFCKLEHAAVLLTALFFSALSVAADISGVVVFGQMFQELTRYASMLTSSTEAREKTHFWIAVLFSLAVLHLIAAAVHFRSWVKFGEQQARSARLQLFSSILSKRMEWFDRNKGGMAALLTAYERNIRELQIATSQILGFIAHDILLSVAGLIVALKHGPIMTLVVVGSVPIAILVMRSLSKMLEKAITTQKEKQVVATRLLAAAISGIDMVKVYGSEAHELHNFRVAVRETGKYGRIQTTWNALQAAFMKIYMASIFVTGFFFGIYQVDQGQMRAGDVLVTFYSALTTFQGLQGIGPHILNLVKGMEASKALKAIVSEPGTQIGGIMKPVVFEGTIQIERVSSAYPSDPNVQVLRSSSLRFERGEMTFLVGGSGSGKSTIANLLVRFYEPSTGEIFFDGLPLKALDLEWVRQNVTLVQQQSTLFSDTLHTNIAIGHPDPEHASRSSVRFASDMALLQSTILSLPQGLDTLVGPGGQNLSGGQRQRVALARARLRDTPVLILDEVTSGLDTQSRSCIMDALRRWRRGKTTIIITHDVSQIGGEDFVYVLDSGEVCEKGLCKQLSEINGGYLQKLLSLSGIGDETRTGNDDSGDGPNLSSTDEEYDVPRINPTLGLPEKDSKRNSFRLSGMSFINPPVAARPMSFLDNSSAAHDDQMGRYNDKRHSRSLSGRSEHRVKEQIVSGRMRKSGVRRSRPQPGVMDAWARTLPDSATGDIEMLPRDSGKKPKSDGTDPHQLSKYDILKTVWAALDTRHRLYAVAAVFWCVVAAGCSPLFAFAFSNLLQVFWATGNKIQVGARWAVILSIVGVIDFTAVFFAFSLAGAVAQEWADMLKVEALLGVLRQPRAWHDQGKNSAARICDVLDRGAEEMKMIVSQFFPSLLMVLLMIGMGIVWAMTVLWHLTLVGLAVSPFVAVCIFFSTRSSKKWETLCNEAAETTGAVLAGVVVDIRVVRAFLLERFFGKRFDKAVEKTYDLGKRRGWITGIWFGVQQSFSQCLVVALFTYGVHLVTTTDSIVVGDIIQVINLLLFTAGSAAMMMASISQVAAAEAKTAQVLQLTKMTTRDQGETGTNRVRTPFPVAFNRLNFAYPGRQQLVLHDVSLSIPGNGCTAIVGSSGCGKSTIAALILRLYDPIYPTDRGGGGSDDTCPLSFGGVDARNLSAKALRSMMGYVPQQPFLFPCTIRDNIAYGLGADEDELRSQHSIESAAREANIHEFIISLPRGYDTVVGDGGVALSGGQAQRVCIARALARRPKLLVLDEPTSALDAASGQAIIDALRNLTAEDGPGSTPISSIYSPHSAYSPYSPQSADPYNWEDNFLRRIEGKTFSYVQGVTSRRCRRQMAVVVVTHSREMMRMADRIIVVNQGRVVETGSYEDLMATAEGKLADLLSSPHGAPNGESTPARSVCGENGSGAAWSGAWMKPSPENYRRDRQQGRKEFLG